MATGLAVVATAASGIPEILTEGEESGGVVVPVDDPAALAGQLARFLGDAELRERVAARARERAVALCSLRAVGARLAELLEAAGADLRPPP
jgi:starch synthase